jgi:hypothetical protein
MTLAKGQDGTRRRSGPKPKDYTFMVGEQYHQIRVLAVYADNTKSRHQMVLALCLVCDQKFSPRAADVFNGKTTTCCLRKEAYKRHIEKHVQTRFTQRELTWIVKVRVSPQKRWEPQAGLFNQKDEWQTHAGLIKFICKKLGMSSDLIDPVLRVERKRINALYPTRELLDVAMETGSISFSEYVNSFSSIDRKSDRRLQYEFAQREGTYAWSWRLKELCEDFKAKSRRMDWEEREKERIEFEAENPHQLTDAEICSMPLPF